MNESEKLLYNLIHDELLSTHTDKDTFLKKVGAIYDRAQVEINDSQFGFIQNELRGIIEKTISTYYPADVRKEMWDLFCEFGGISLLENVTNTLKDELLMALYKAVVDFHNSRSPTEPDKKPSDEKKKTLSSSDDDYPHEWKWKLVDPVSGTTTYIDKFYVGGKLVYDKEASTKEAEKKTESKASAPKRRRNPQI